MAESHESDVALNEEITVTTRETAVKSRFINRQHILIEALFKNTAKLYVALSYEPTGVRSTGFEPLNAGEYRFYGAPANCKITYLWFYAESGTQKYNYFASDGSIIRGLKAKTYSIQVWRATTAGNSKTLGVPSNKRFRFLYGLVNYTSGGVTGNRNVEIIVHYGSIAEGDYFYRRRCNTAIPASSNRMIALHPNVPQDETAPVWVLPLPEIIDEAFNITIRDANNIDAGDDCHVRLIYEQYDLT